MVNNIVYLYDEYIFSESDTVFYFIDGSVAMVIIAAFFNFRRLMYYEEIKTTNLSRSACIRNVY